MNILCAVSYDGSCFSGWQIQPDKTTVQSVIEEALRLMSGSRIRTTVAGRTDAGVHALKNYFNFKVEELLIPVDRLPVVLNTMLPDGVRILSAENVDETFSSRYSCRKRIYEYIIVNGEKTPFLCKYRMFFKRQFNIELMDYSIKKLIGKYDFSGFKSIDCNSKNQIREIYYAAVHQKNDEIIIRIEANGFLKNMIRIIVGTLLDIERGKKKPEIIDEIIETRNRGIAGKTVSPNGLFFVDAIFER